MSGLPGEQGPPRSRSPLLLASTGAGVLATVGLAAVLLDPALFGGTVLDRGAVERDVAVQFQQREGVAITLVCPSAMPAVTGRSYRCAGPTATGEHVTVRIVVTHSSPAAYTWTAR